MKLPAQLPLAAAVMLAMSGCQTTSVSTIWKAPISLSTHPFNKVVALVVNATPGERRAAEDTLAAEVHKAVGIPAYTLIADEDVADRDQLKARLHDKGVDGLVVLRLVASDKSTSYHPPTYTYGGEAYAHRSGYYSGPLYSPGYTVTTVVISGEVSVYSVEDDRLLWAGATSTTDPRNVQDLVVQVAAAARQELRKQGMIQ